MTVSTSFLLFSRHLYRLKCPEFSNICRKNFHLYVANCSKLRLKERTTAKQNIYFARRESAFYHRVLEENPKYSNSVLKPDYFPKLLEATVDNNFNLDDDVTKLEPESFLPFIAMVTKNVLDQNIEISSPKLLALANHIKKNSRALQMDSVSKILSLMYLWPVTNRLMYPCMHTIILALDHASMATLPMLKNVALPLDEILLWMEPWHWLELCTMSEFVQAAVGKLFWRADKPEHIIQLLFYMGELRTLPNHYDRPSVEKKVVRYMKYFSADEVGILSAGFYKSSTKLTNYILYKQLVKRVLKGPEKFNEISLNAVLKLLRANIASFNEMKDVDDMQKAILPLVPNLSGMCLVQAMMLGTPMERIDRTFITNILERLCQVSSELREKDFERVMYVCAMSMEEEDVSDFVNCVVNEVNKRNLSRIHEFEDPLNNSHAFTKSVSFIEIVLFLHILGYRSREWIAAAIEIGSYINIKPFYTVALHHLDVMSDILFPDYSGPRLTEEQRRLYYDHWFPGKSVQYPTIHWFSYEWREVPQEMLRRLYLNVCDACGGNSFVGCLSLLPLYEHRDLVVCVDNDGSLVPLPPGFGVGDSWRVKPPIKSEDHSFIVLILLRDRSKYRLPDYTLYQKLRQELLEKLGYRIAVVRYKVFEDIPKEEKTAVILEAIKNAK